MLELDYCVCLLCDGIWEAEQKLFKIRLEKEENEKKFYVGVPTN